MQTLPEQYHGRRPVPRHRRPRYRLRRLIALLLGIILLFGAFIGISLVGALRSPGNQNFQAKWADWLRSHHAAVLASTIEQWYYDLNAPSKGGRPSHLNAVPAPVASKTPSTAPAVKVPKRPGLTPPTAISLVVTPGLSGEGQWQPADAQVDGVPAMYVAQFRADTVYTGQITSAVWIDPTLLRIALVPGAQEPGGTWPETPYVDGSALGTLVAAFNGGFRMQDAHGGFYLDGRQEVPLRAGAASIVIYSNGRVDVGAWGSEVTMTPGVVAVLQNLIPIVDGGQPAPSATYSDTSIWGATLGASTVVARSGVGVTASGALVYVAGPALTARTLAESLQRAGAVRAMALDINPEWVTFNFYSHPLAASPTVIAATKLYPQMQRPADRYIGPTRESRDFFTVSLPSAA